MKTLKAVCFALIAVVAMLAGRQTMAADRGFEGTITDSMCTGRHMMPGKSDAECIKACVHDGSKYVLVSGKSLYRLAAKQQVLDSFAGKHVVVHGSMTGTTITVASIEEAKEK